MREIEVRELPYLPLGHQGENEAQRIVWRGLADSWARFFQKMLAFYRLIIALFLLFHYNLGN